MLAIRGYPDRNALILTVDVVDNLNEMGIDKRFSEAGETNSIKIDMIFINNLPYYACILRFAEESPHDKPVVVAFEEGSLSATEKAIRELRQAGIIVFPSLPRACRALRRFAGYHRFVAESRVWGNEG